MATILAMVGSIVTPCGVARLTHVAAEGARAAGAVVTEVQLLDLDLPLFSFDREASVGMPEAARGLKRMVESHDGLLVGAPELNRSVTGVLKNAIDWVARPEQPDGPRNRSFEGKVAAMVSGSKWDHAGLRGLEHLRSILSGVGVTVIPDQISVAHAPPRFDEDGTLDDEALAAEVRAVGAALVRALERQEERQR